LGDASVVVVIGLGSVVWLVVIFAENGFGNDIFFGGPVAQVLHLAAFAAKRELGMDLGVGRFLTDRTAVLHGLVFFSVTSVRSVLKSISPQTSQR
jgi:hypothetical protein